MNIFLDLQFIGWLVVGLVMTIFALTGGFDFGAGILLPFIGKTDAEKRTVLNTVGPTWDGNQVWLITAGGAIFAIWPRVYAASFSGLYFAFLLVLWCLFFRPVAFEYRAKFKSEAMKKVSDWALFVGSFIPPLIVGVGVGNLFLGLPFQFDPQSLRFFYGHSMVDAAALTDLFKLLQPFALLCGLVSVLMMMMHGASYLKMRTEGEVYHRSCKVIKYSSLLLFVLFALGGVWIAFGINGFEWHSMANPMQHPLTNNVTRGVGAWLLNYSKYPVLIIAPVIGLLGALYTAAIANKDGLVKSFVASSVTIFAIMATWGFSLFPFIMPSSVKPAQSLLVFNASSSEISLIGIIITAVIMLPIIFAYTTFVYKKLWGRGYKMSPETIEKHHHELY